VREEREMITWENAQKLHSGATLYEEVHYGGLFVFLARRVVRIEDDELILEDEEGEISVSKDIFPFEHFYLDE
jgi:hypothetical protein